MRRFSSRFWILVAFLFILVCGAMVMAAGEAKPPWRPVLPAAGE